MTAIFVSLDTLTADDKAFLLQSLAEFCAGYDAYMRGDFPEFQEMPYQTKVANTKMRLDQLVDDLMIIPDCPLSN